MKRSRFVSLGLTALFLASPTVTFAGCVQKGSLVCGTGSSNIASGGALQVSRGGDFAPFESGSALKGGDRILTSADATLNLGPSCQAPVGAGSLVSIKRDGKKTCASVSEQPTQGVTQVDAPVVDPVLVGAGLAAAAAVGVGVALSQNGNGGTVSGR